MTEIYEFREFFSRNRLEDREIRRNVMWLKMR